MTSQQAQQRIDGLDKLIDANRVALMNRLHVSPGMSAHCWQNAWDRCPDLHARECELYRQRGVAQQQRDQEINKAWQIEHRATRAKLRKQSQSRCGSVHSPRTSPGASQGLNADVRETGGLGAISYSAVGDRDTRAASTTSA